MLCFFFSLFDFPLSNNTSVKPTFHMYQTLKRIEYTEPPQTCRYPNEHHQPYLQHCVQMYSVIPSSSSPESERGHAVSVLVGSSPVELHASGLIGWIASFPMSPPNEHPWTFYFYFLLFDFIFPCSSHAVLFRSLCNKADLIESEGNSNGHLDRSLPRW